MYQGAKAIVEIVIMQVVWSCHLSGIRVKLEALSGCSGPETCINTK